MRLRRPANEAPASQEPDDAPPEVPSHDLWQEPGHYYSPLTSKEDVARALAESSSHGTVELHEEAQLLLAEQLAPMWRELPRDLRWERNDFYDVADASILSSMLRRDTPRRLVEIGSGYSSAVLLDTCERYGLDIDMTFVDPNPERLLGLLSDADHERVTVRREIVQETPGEVFGTLEAGDLLMIDSTHVVKAGSDVLHLFFRVLPSLPLGVRVHIHDVFWPWQYPETWLRQHRDWSELYFLHAFLSYNAAWKVDFFSDWLWQEHPSKVSEWAPELGDERPGALWISRVG